MNKRRTGYCPICDANIVHGRVFVSRWAWRLDRMSFSFLEGFNVGPWRCVDCGNRQMFIERFEGARRDIDENEDQGVDANVPVGNFLRTKDSLVHTVVDTARFSEKYRGGVVQKLLDGKITVSKVCGDLAISEFEIQRWIRCWLDSELGRRDVSNSDVHKLIPFTGNAGDDQGDWGDAEPASARINESEVLRRNK